MRVPRFLLAAADVARWPFERLAWSVEQRLLWPLQERAAGWGPPRHAAGAGALAAIAVLAVLAGVLLLPGGEAEPPREQVAAPARVAVATPPPQAKKQKKQTGRALQGPPPSFSVSGGVGVARGDDEDADAGSASATADATADADSATDEPAAEEAAAATASSREPVPAGPAAMKAARRFSEAFLFYEIGQRRERAEEVFGETATPRLAEALSGRSPRQPANGEVPKAKVVNLVPGPRAGRAYTVSVSLLRVGLTTELRLELRKRGEKWLVTDVKG